MSKNRLTDLNDHLFEQLERLNDDNLTPEQIDVEARRSAAMVDIADQLIENAKARLTAAKLFAEYGQTILPYLPKVGRETPAQIEGKTEQ